MTAFVFEIEGGRVRAGQRSGGDDDVQPIAEFAFSAPLDGKRLDALQWYLEGYISAPFGQWKDEGARVHAVLRAWGQELFATLFDAPQMQVALAGAKAKVQAWDAQPQPTPGPRPAIDIVLRSREPAVLAMPWELMQAPAEDRPFVLMREMGGLRRDCYSQTSAVARPAGATLRVLMVISRPRGPEDVDFQMVARPLQERLGQVSGQVALEVTRPQTFAALEQILMRARDAGQPYHVVHFDGHGAFTRDAAAAAGALGSERFDAGAVSETGYLIFEPEAADQPHHAVSAAEFADLIVRAGVPIVVMNACQSASQGRAESAVEASVATKLLSQGVNAVVAMSHSVYATTAAAFMAAFYEALFAGKGVVEAVNAGRASLYKAQEREVRPGLLLELQDWIVPVLYARSNPRFEALQSAPGMAPQETAGPDDLAPEAGYFVGRGREFHAMELAMQAGHVTLLQGPAGTGKTELAKAFARWWSQTGGTAEPARVMFFSFAPGLATQGLDGFLTEFTARYLGQDVPEKDREVTVLEVLRGAGFLLILDNIESLVSLPEDGRPVLDGAEQARLRAFLGQLSAPGGTSRVLLTSRTAEDWLAQGGGPQPLRRIKVGPLDALATELYAQKLIAGYGEAGARLRGAPEDYKALLEWLGGHPLSMKLVLPHLEETSASEILKSLRGQGPLPPGFAGQGRTEGLGASLRYSLDHLSPADRACVPVLALFEGSVDANALGVMSKQDGVPAPWAGISTEDWQALLTRMAGLGLLSPIGGPVFGLHPALPGYLAATWRDVAGPEHAAQQDQLITALITAHAAMGQWLDSQIDAGDAQMAFFLLATNRRQYGRMIRTALDRGQFDPAQHILQALIEYLQTRGMVAEIQRWCADALGACGPDPAFDTEAGALWLYAQSVRANQALGAHDLAGAEAVFDTIRERLEADAPSQKRDRRLASSYHQLGRVAQQRGDLDTAQGWYTKSLEIEEELGNRPGMASSYHQLGRVAQQRGDLDRAQGLYTKSLEIKDELGNRPGMANSYHQLGIVAQERGDLDTAQGWYTKSLEINEELGNRPGMATSYHQLGIVAQLRGDLDRAQGWYTKSLEIREELGDRPGMAGSYHQLGMVAQQRGDLDRAQGWYTKSLEIEDELGNRPGMADSYHQLGIVGQLRGDLDTAQGWYTKSLEIMDELGNRPGMANSYHQLGMVAQQRGDLDRAQGWYTKSLEIMEELGNRPGMANSYHQLGMVAQQRGDLDRAQGWYTKSLEIMEELGNRPDMASSYNQLGSLALKKDDPQQALRWLIKALLLIADTGSATVQQIIGNITRMGQAYSFEMVQTIWQEETGNPLPDQLAEAIEKSGASPEDDK